MAETLVLSALSTTGTTLSFSQAATLASTLSALPSAGAVATGLSVAGALQSGQAQAASFKAQAQQNELAARQEELKGRQQADQIRRGLQSALSAQNAIFAARGINPNTGTPRALAQKSMRAAGQDIETSMFNAGMNVAQERAQAGQLRISASQARMVGYGEAAGIVGSYGKDTGIVGRSLLR